MDTKIMVFQKRKVQGRWQDIYYIKIRGIRSNLVNKVGGVIIWAINREKNGRRLIRKIIHTNIFYNLMLQSERGSSGLPH